MDFDKAFDELIGIEGGYSNSPSDPGGETMWGITARVAHANGYQGEMRLLPKDMAKAICRKLYWDAVHADELPDALRYPMLDAAYNSGAAQAIKWLQRAVGVQDDGAMGPMTIAAAALNPQKAAAASLAHRLDFLTSLPTWGGYGRGWARRVAAVLQGVFA